MPDHVRPGLGAAGPASPTSPATVKPVVDLRDEVPIRHRPTRGVPGERDRHLAAYRDHATRPSHHYDRQRRLVEVGEVDAVREQPGPHDGGAPPAGPAELDTTPASSARVPPTATTSTTSADRKRFDIGELVVRRVRLRSVFKVALALNLCLLAVGMVAGAILWRLANEQGWVTGWTGFLVDIGFTDADVDGVTLARASATIGGILAATATLLTVATACLYNQVAGLIGGLAVSVGPRRRGAR